MRTLLTIDWDFFIPIDPCLDIGMAESEFFIFNVWEFRLHLMQQIITNGWEKHFWEWIRSWAKINKKAKLHVSESHCDAYAIANQYAVKQIVSFDTHHDCWTGHALACETWLNLWLDCSQKRHAIWIRPEEKSDFTLLSSARIEQKVFEESPPVGAEHEIMAVHVCRSGGWTPPWLDEQFIDFIADGLLRMQLQLQKEIVLSQELRIDAMIPRWNPEKLKALIAAVNPY